MAMLEQLAHLLLLPGDRAGLGLLGLAGRPRGCLGIWARSSLRVVAKACSTALRISLRTWNSQT